MWNDGVVPLISMVPKKIAQFRSNMIIRADAPCPALPILTGQTLTIPHQQKNPSVSEDEYRGKILMCQGRRLEFPEFFLLGRGQGLNPLERSGTAKGGNCFLLINLRRSGRGALSTV